ncbi:MAG: hypothetical protein ABIU05_03250, partial [Nitrospirales bacterium]
AKRLVVGMPFNWRTILISRWPVSKPLFEVFGQPSGPARAVIASIADKYTAYGLLLPAGFSLTSRCIHKQYQLRYLLFRFFLQVRTPQSLQW